MKQLLEVLWKSQQSLRLCFHNHSNIFWLGKAARLREAETRCSRFTCRTELWSWRVVLIIPSSGKTRHSFILNIRQSVIVSSQSIQTNISLYDTWFYFPVAPSRSSHPPWVWVVTLTCNLLCMMQTSVQGKIMVVIKTHVCAALKLELWASDDEEITYTAVSGQPVASRCEEKAFCISVRCWGTQQSLSICQAEDGLQN